MAWRKIATTITVDNDVDLNEDFMEEQLLQGLVNAHWLSEQEAQAILERQEAREKEAGLPFAYSDDLVRARDLFQSGNKEEALVYLERFLGRDWIGVLK